MAKVVEGVGKTYDEAVKNGLDKIGLSQEEVIEALENHYQFVEQTDEHAFNVLEDFTPKVKHLVK